MELFNKLFFSIFCSVILLNLISCGAAAPQQAVINLNPQEKFQTITGWEATAQAGQDNAENYEKYRDELLEKAVNDLGINRLRLEIKSGAENPTDYFTQWQEGRIDESDFNEKRYEIINDNDDPFVINEKGFQFSKIDAAIEKVVLPMRKLLAEHGESLYLNLNFVDFFKNKGNSNMRHSENPEEYAELMLAAFQHMKNKYGFTPDAIEVILEPDNKTGWTGTDIGKVTVATAKRLRENNFNPAFIVPGTKNMANASKYIDEIAQIPGALDFVSEFSYHRYGGVSEKALRQIVERAEKYGKKTAMLEKIGADYKSLHEDLKIGNNSAWQQYTLAFPNPTDNGGKYFQIKDYKTENPSIILGTRSTFLRQYFRFIHRGAQRIGADTNNENLDPVAFINSDGGYVVVVKAEVPGTVSVQNLPAGNYGISYTTSEQAGFDAPDVNIKKGEPLRAKIPADGVLTIYAKSIS